MIRLLVLVSTLVVFAQSQNCNVQNFPNGTVCTCNATYCDTVPSLNVSAGNYQLYSTSQSTAGFSSNSGSFSTSGGILDLGNLLNLNTLTIDPSVTYQEIIGFGGAFTDSAGINIASLSEAAQQKLLESYFSDNGIEYNLCRVPIGGTDFSTRPYSYDDTVNDTSLSNFTLQPEDYNYKIPYIHQAQNLTGNKLKLFATPWTAPPWMKTDDGWAGVGVLETQYYQVWANYLIKFFDAYESNNITFWGLTAQNEPVDGFIPENISAINAMGYTPDEMNTFIGYYLGPTLNDSAHSNIKLIIHDDQRAFLPLLQTLLLDELTMSFVDGVGVHWYTDTTTPAAVLATITSPYKDVFALGTEACNFATATEPAVDYGSWSRGASYATDIFEDLNYGLQGWVDWNMALNGAGGPNYINGNADSPIIVNSTLQVFYKQPTFYVLGHFSKFVIPGSVRVEASVSLLSGITGVQALAFLRPDNLTAVVIFNSGPLNVSLTVEVSNNQCAQLNIEANSINTLLYNNVDDD